MKLRSFLTGILFALLCTSIHAQTTPLVSHGDIWLCHKGTNAPQVDWKTAPDGGLGDSWFQGAGGFGFADNTGETVDCQTLLTDMLNRYTTFYIRRQFTITNDLSTNQYLKLRMDWDDGCLVWLDGIFITNANYTAAPAEPPNTGTATSNHESSHGNSSPQPAVTHDLGPAHLRLATGTHTLAILGLNGSSSSTDFILVPDLYLETFTPPPPPTNTVGGIIASDTTWFSTNGTYNVTSSVTVASGATLTVEPGLRIQFSQATSLTVQGRLLADGTEAQPVRFTRAPGATRWERIKFIEATDSRLQHCVIEYANCVGDHKDYYPTNCSPLIFAPRNYHEAVVVLACHVDFDGCSFTNLPDASATAEGDAMAIISDDKDHPGPASANVRNSHFIHIGQGVHTRYAYVLVENCVFQDKHGDNDDVDLYGESVPSSIVRNNWFLYPSYDDRIHPTKCSALIIGNTIYGSTDHGIVLRDVCNPVVMNNVLYSCSAGGISVQNGCDALLINNTLVNCNRAIKLFDHLNRINDNQYCLTAASGKATLINNIIWNSTPAFDLSGSAVGTLSVNVAYSDIQGGTNNATLGTSGKLVGGPGNIDVDPLFLNRTATNFHLTAASPCLDVGTNLSAILTSDFDGTPRPLDGNGDSLASFDMGAYEFLLPTADSNGDGIPDGWCRDHGFNPIDPNVAAGNPDNDPFTTGEEWTADTDPTNSSSFFRIIAISNQPPVTVHFQSSSNRVYTLLGTSNLTQAAWSRLPGQTDVPGAGGPDALIDTNDAPRQFYRIEVKTP
jgi:parallel beta-helix repeat protein